MYFAERMLSGPIPPGGMSVAGGKADVPAAWPRLPSLATNGHSGDAYPALALLRGAGMGLWLAGEVEEGGRPTAAPR